VRARNAPAENTAITRFASVLFLPDEVLPSHRTSTDALHDLALDQVIEALTAREPTGALAEVFQTPLATVDAIRYRQEVFRDLDDPETRAMIVRFLDELRDVDQLQTRAAKSHYRYQVDQWHLNAVCAYADAVEGLHQQLPDMLNPGGSSRALRGLLGHVQRYLASGSYLAVRDQARRLRESVDAVRYDLLIQGAKVTVAGFDEEPDLGTEVLATFERFRQGAVKDYHIRDDERGDIDHVQAAILERVGQLRPELFTELVAFTKASWDFPEPVISRFAHEVRFYLEYLDYLAPLRKAGLATCYPVVSAESKELSWSGSYDLALAHGLVDASRPVIVNDLSLDGAERILVVSGPNQGGKSTTARSFGQLHHLAAVGCPVAGTEASVFLVDRVLTHFEREESIETLEGRLGEDVQRIHQLLDEATGRSAIVLNELFNSTALEDARVLTGEVLERISALDAVCACVTFIDELSRLNEKTVSMVSLVDPDDPAIRTFRVERREADGRAYALALARKYRLTADQLSERIGDRAS
jgi:hypothetical protein